VRVTILWKQLSAHTSACFAALADAGASVRLVHRATTSEAPYDDDELANELPGWPWSDRCGWARLRAELDAHPPDAMLVCSWDVLPYVRAARAWRGQTLRVLCTDNPWLGTPRQWAGRLVAPILIRPTFDLAFLPGERQMVFARMLGFEDRELLWGLYSADQPRFVAASAGRAALNRSFVFVGRLVPEKAVDVLARAYVAYRAESPDPWPLQVAGTGPLAAALEGIPGVSLDGFVQPSKLPALLASNGCLVLPSRFEPWGVAIHEAAAAGLPIVCTDSCGASTRFVLDGYNGRVIPAEDPRALANALRWVAAHPADDLEALGRQSAALSQQLTPQRWASYLLDRLREAAAGAPR